MHFKSFFVAEEIDAFFQAMLLHIKNLFWNIEQEELKEKEESRNAIDVMSGPFLVSVSQTYPSCIFPLLI